MQGCYEVIPFNMSVSITVPHFCDDEAHSGMAFQLPSHRFEAATVDVYLGCEATQLPFGQGSRKIESGTEDTE